MCSHGLGDREVGSRSQRVGNSQARTEDPVILAGPDLRSAPEPMLDDLEQKVVQVSYVEFVSKIKQRHRLLKTHDRQGIVYRSRILGSFDLSCSIVNDEDRHDVSDIFIIHRVSERLESLPRHAFFDGADEQLGVSLIRLGVIPEVA